METKIFFFVLSVTIWENWRQFISLTESKTQKSEQNGTAPPTGNHVEQFLYTKCPQKDGI